MLGLSCVTEAQNLALSLQNTRISNQGHWNLSFSRYNDFDFKNSNRTPNSPNAFYTMGIEYRHINFRKFKEQYKFNVEFPGHLLYLYGLSSVRRDPKADYFATKIPIYFTTLFIDYTGTWNLYTTDRMVLGLGVGLNDLRYTYNGQMYDDDTRQILPKADWGIFLGPAFRADFLITKELTLHADIYRNFGLLFSEWKRYNLYEVTPRPFDFLRGSAMLIHQSGVFVEAKYSQMLNNTELPLSAARFHTSLGIRFNMYKYNGESYKLDPRRNSNKKTF